MSREEEMFESLQALVYNRAFIGPVKVTRRMYAILWNKLTENANACWGDPIRFRGVHFELGERDLDFSI